MVSKKVDERTSGEVHSYHSLCTGPGTKALDEGFPGGAVVESLPANAGGTGSSPGLGDRKSTRLNSSH